MAGSYVLNIFPHSPPYQKPMTPQYSSVEPQQLDAMAKQTANGSLRVAILVAYEGSAFQGWQLQPHGPTVQGKLEEALQTITGTHVRVQGSGRTDAGVHGRNQVAHFDLPAPRSLHKLRASLNGLCAPTISVKQVIPVPAGFHARHDARGKTYCYHLFHRPYPPVFAKSRCWWIKHKLDVDSMRAAATHLLGEHDFSAFRSIDCAAKSPVHTLRRVEMEEGDWPDATLRITFEATGFLQHMARIITGTLVAVGAGRFSPDDVKQILASKNREQAGETAPGRGLHLLHVHYDTKAFSELAAFEQENTFWETPELIPMEKEHP